MFKLPVLLGGIVVIVIGVATLNGLTLILGGLLVAAGAFYFPSDF